MWQNWHRQASVSAIAAALAIVLWGIHTATVGQTVNGFRMPHNPYAASFQRQPVAAQRSAHFGVSRPPSTFGHQGSATKPFSHAPISHRPLITSEDMARWDIRRSLVPSWNY